MLHYFLRRFLAIFLLASGLNALSAQDSGYKIAAIGFYNLENLFDTVKSPNTNDEEYLPNSRLKWNTEKYVSKQRNMAKVVSQLATEKTPDGVAILGVAEIENRKVLEDLVAEPELKARNYQIVHYESPDPRGIDCAFLYNPKYFRLTGSRSVNVPLIDPVSGDQRTSRDIIYMAGELDGEMIHLMVGHWPSRRGGEKNTEWARIACARKCRELADSICAAQPGAKIFIMGDLNDDPTSKSLVEGLKARKSAKDLINDCDLYNPMYAMYKDGNGTLAYRDAWSLFDQIIISRPLVHKDAGGWQMHRSVVFRQPWLLQAGGAFAGYPFRTFVGDAFINGYSDHLPVYLFLLKKI
ncbi:MAG: endonuclease/exonuclease/phosphatase family protein [Saprospiraceae bacterium]